LTRIRDHGIGVALITGNHDTPRLPGTGSPYSSLADTFPEFHFAHRLAYERFDLGSLVVHAVPQMLTVQATLEALEQADRQRSLTAANLLLTHPRVTQVEPRYSDINEIEIDAGLLRSDFVLLGHYHFHTQVAEGIWYAGSTDTFSFADDPEKAKGVVLLDTDTGECHHLPLTGQRPLLTLPTVEALSLSPSELRTQVLERVALIPEGAVARLYIEAVDPEAYRLLDLEEIRTVGAAALQLKLEPSFTDAATLVSLPDLSSMPAQWERYLEGQDLTGFDRERLRALGHHYLSQAVEASV
jgi:DNA repair exonuclease SbcCD nuclease subunit